MKTYGYDYSFAVSVEEINAILSENLQNVDMEMQYAGTDTVVGSTITLNAKMLPWQIIKGGQNSLLRFAMPLQSGTLTIKGVINNNYKLDGVVINVEVTLGWLGVNTIASQGGGNLTKLVFSPTQSTDPCNPGYVSIVSILDPNHCLDTVGMGVLGGCAANMLIENKDKMNYVFANVFPNPSSLASWLKPYAWIYYYSTGQTYDALCFLCLLSDKTWPQTPAFDSSALIVGSNANILISQSSFFANVVLPSLETSFSGANFSLSSDSNENCTIQNDNSFYAKISKRNIKVDTFKVTVSDDGNGLKIHSAGGGPLKFFFGIGKLPHASYSWNCTNTNPLQYTNEKITFLKDESPITHHHQSIHWYDWFLLVAVGITSLPGLISVIVDSINGFSNQVNDIGIGNINQSLANSSSQAVFNLANLITWSENNKKFSTQSAGLDGALFIHGNLQ